MVLGLTSSEEIKVKIISEKDCLQTISVEWPATKVKAHIEAAFQTVQSQAKIPGFRPGKSPIELVRKQYQETAFARAQDAMLREGISEALKVKKINAVQSPVVENIKFDPEKPFHFEFKVEVAPHIKPAGYKGLKLTSTKKVINDADVEKTLIGIAEMNSRLEESKELALGPKNFAVIDYEGFIDGKALPGGKSENFLLDMGAPQTITGLSDGLIGAKVGEEREIKVKFPEDSPAKEFAGKEASFKVILKTIKEKKIPAMTDEFAKDLGTTTLAELKIKVRESLEHDAVEGSRKDLEKQVETALLEENKFPVPPTLVQDQTQYIENRMKQNLARQGYNEGDQNTMLANRKAESARMAEQEIRLAYLTSAIATEEKIEVSDDEVTAKINDMLDKAHPTERPAYEKAITPETRAHIRSDLREKKVMDWIIHHSKIKEETGGGK